MPSADTETVQPEGQSGPVDEARQGLLDALTAELGEGVIDSYLAPGRELWVRVGAPHWASAADALKNKLNYRFFDWLSAIDWMPSPYVRSMDAEVDKELGLIEGADGAQSTAHSDSGADGDYERGYAGGETRIQMLARVHSLETNLGLTLKADVPDLTIGSWTGHFPGADWHEREAWEMFGITFEGHPGLRHLYLPGDFQGHPMRKDYPLLARIIKPWPGIVDVEPMPPQPSAAASGGPSTTNPEAAS